MKKATAFQWLFFLCILFCVCIILLIAFLYLYSSVFEKAQPDPTVEISTNAPASSSNVVLHLKVREPSNLLATNYSSWGGNLSLMGGSSFGGSSVDYSSFGGSSVDETIQKWFETRLTAINAEGFEVLFTKRWRLSGSGQKINQETNVILFRYGQITETNTLGWRIVGKFK